MASPGTKAVREADELDWGEFSTSYLADPLAPERIHEHYPGVRMLVCLRNPADRAFSNFLNDVQAGTLPPDARFYEVLGSHPEYLAQGAYATQLQRYLDRFPRESLLVLLYDDLERDLVVSCHRSTDFWESTMPRIPDAAREGERRPRTAFDGS